MKIEYKELQLTMENEIKIACALYMCACVHVCFNMYFSLEILRIVLNLKNYLRTFKFQINGWTGR